ncbi:hypothetical protein KAR48_05680 [bacterium]|nr:hypothetical protein [bacterium]
MLFIIIPIAAYFFVYWLARKYEGRKRVDAIRTVIGQAPEGSTVYIAAGELKEDKFITIKNLIYAQLDKGIRFELIGGPKFCIKHKKWLQYIKNSEGLILDNIPKLHFWFDLAVKFPEQVQIYTTYQGSNSRFRLPYHFICTSSEETLFVMEDKHPEMGVASVWTGMGYDLKVRENVRHILLSLFEYYITQEDLVSDKLQVKDGHLIGITKDRLVSELSKRFAIFADNKKIKKDIKILEEKHIDLSWWAPHKLIKAIPVHHSS